MMVYEMAREERFMGKIEFDVIVNGKCIERVEGGILAHVTEDKQLAVKGEGGNIGLMAATVGALMEYLLEHNHVDVLEMVLENLMEKRK